MKIKLDENIPTELAGFLSRLGHEVDTVRDERLNGKPDPEVWQAAQSARRFLITQDLDFSDARVYRPGTHIGILVVRLREATRRRLIDRLSSILERNAVSDWERCVVIASENRIRIRRPPDQN